MATASPSIDAMPTATSAPLRAPTVDARALPIIGALPALLRDAPGAMLAAAARHRGELFALRLGPASVPIICEPEHLQEVLIDKADDFTKAGMWDATRPMLGEGLVTSDGDFWRRQRRLMQPLFSQKHLASLSELMIGAISAQLDQLAERARGGALIDVGAEMTLITQRVLMETIFGVSLSAEESERLGKNLVAGFEAMNYRIFLYFLPKWIPRPGSRVFFSSIAEIDKTLMRLVAERRARPTERVDMLNQLLAATDADTGERMSDKQIRDELITLFVAGLDTTAITLTWMMWLLDMHPAVDSRMRAEIEGALGGRRPTMEDLPKLAYTRSVVQETMRLYPPAWMFPRYTRDGTVIGGRRIAPGTSVLVSPYVTHRDPTYWPNPELFDPERFTPERSVGRPKLAFAPFGAGTRQCIGNHFAMMEAQLAATLLVQRFRARTAPGQRVEPASASTLKPRFGLKMTFKPA